MSILFLLFIFSPLTCYQIELDSIDPDVFEELAPQGIEYSDIHKLEKISNLTFLHQIDQIIDKMNLTFTYLKMSSYYLSEHKYWEIDWRLYSLNDPDIMNTYYITMGFNFGYSKLATFMFSFPKPPIKNPYPEVVDNCESSAFKCLEYIGEITLINRGWQRKLKNQLIKSETEFLKNFLNTFEDNWQLFNFRATASYYLCWFTLRRNPLFKKFHQDYCPATNSKLSIDFKCAQISFCPDACCGELYPKLKNNFKFTWEKYISECRNFELNPCYKIGDGQCELSEIENNNFEDLKLNKINVTCDCPSGYIYSNEYKMCIDIDECITSSHNCKTNQNESCLNLPGSFECVCTKGYILDKYKLTSQNSRCINESAIFDLK